MDCYFCFSPVKPKEKKVTSALDFFGSTSVAAWPWICIVTRN